ncbi:MAG: S41 family peptidase [Phycisphaerae bacterium]|nr:S41 family peptidase [Phycisphaerae bacterium]
MKRVVFLNRIWILLVVAGLFVAPVLGDEAAAKVAKSAKPAKVVKPAKPAKVAKPAASDSPASRLTVGLEQALRGDFDTALATLRQVAKQAPADESVCRAVGLLESHVKRLAASHAERKKEYEYEIQRLKWAYLAQKNVEKLDKAPYGKAFREKIKKQLSESYNAIGTATGFEESSAKDAAEMTVTSLAEIDKTSKILADALGLIKKQKGEFATEFRRIAANLQKQLEINRGVWKSINAAAFKDQWQKQLEINRRAWSVGGRWQKGRWQKCLQAIDLWATPCIDPVMVKVRWQKCLLAIKLLAATPSIDPKGRWQGARKLWAVQDDLADAVTDIEVMVVKKPWRIALIHGRIAKEIAPEKGKVANQLWYIELLKDAENRGRAAIEDAKWIDALSAYLTLEELEPNNKKYKAELTKVRRHVRVLRLYCKDDENGKEEPLIPTPKKDKDEKDQEFWKEMVAGVDAQMVRKAISKLGTSYVKPVDFRKLTCGALESIKILAQTPQVAKTFAGLKDKAKQKAFIDAIDKEIKDVKRKDRVDHVRLLMALNKVMFNSEKTVNIPIEVLAVEFADGFLSELDKFSSMIWPFDVTNFNKSTMGHFTGIGVQITKEPGEPLKVITPLLGTPAYKAGIKAGDLILKVGDVSTKNKTIDKLIKIIMGPPGTKVELTIKRRGLPKPLVVPVCRQAVRIVTVKGWQRRKDGQWSFLLNPERKIGYIRITQFTGTTPKALHDALEEMKAAGVESLVLDLRSNPGGLLRSATAVANEFLPKGRDIVYTRGRQVPRHYIHSDDNGTYLKGNLVVLVDQNSASAAEILSGALKDLHRGMILGRRSYGKGSVQNVIPVRREEAYLKLTTAYYYLPSGRLLHREENAIDWGVSPDVDVFLTPRQSRRWRSLRQKTDLLQEFVPELLQADLASQYKTDLQLTTAVLMLDLMKLKTDQAKLFAADTKAKNPS